MRFVGLIIVGMLVGCGYHLEGTNPPLPNKARSIAVRPIDNRTFQGDLETQLMKHLKRLLRNNSSVSLREEEKADLIIDVRLNELGKEQASISPDGLAVEETLLLKGKVVLLSRATNRVIWSENGMTAKTNLLYDKGEDTSGVTSSTLGRGIEQITEAFAHRIYERLFFSF